MKKFLLLILICIFEYICLNDLSSYSKFSSITKYDMNMIEKNMPIKLENHLVKYKSKNSSKNITVKYLSNEFYWKVLGTKNNGFSNKKY